MAELMVVSNPKKRRKAHKARRRRRKMTALQRKYFGGGRRRRRKSHAHAAASNPKRRRRRSHRKHHVKRRRTIHALGIHRNPHRRRRSHRNPSLRGFTGAIMPTVKAGAWGAAGALGLDALWGLVYPRLGTFSSYLDNPYIGFAAKAVGAVAVGTFGGKVARGRGRQLAEGAMTVVAHDFLKSLLTGMLPTVFGPGGAVPLGAYLSGSAPIVGTATIPQVYLPFNGVVPDQFGAYMSGSSGQSGGDNGMYNEDRTGLDPWNG